MELTREEQALQDTVYQFAQDVVAPVIGKHYEAETFPYEVISQMGELGLFGLPFPEEYGGMGGDYFTLCLAIEQLARVDSSVAITLEAAVSLGAMPIYRFGTEEQKRTWLPDLLAGRALGAFGLTESSSGSDAGNIATTAVRHGDDWVINGAKVFITNSGTDITKFVTVTANTGTKDAPEISAILVPNGTPGFTVAPKYSKVGWNASDTHELSFDNVRVPVGNLIGEPGRGYAQFLRILDEGRIAIAALAVGLSQGCVDECTRYVQEREAFGRPIGKNQAIAFKLADIATRTHVGRLATYDAGRRLSAGQEFKTQAAMAKLVSTEDAVTNAREATQIFGGYGFMNEYPVARFWRDSKVLEIGEGTSEVQRMLIARSLGI